VESREAALKLISERNIAAVTSLFGLFEAVVVGEICRVDTGTAASNIIEATKALVEGNWGKAYEYIKEIKV